MEAAKGDYKKRISTAVFFLAHVTIGFVGGYLAVFIERYFRIKMAVLRTVVWFFLADSFECRKVVQATRYSRYTSLRALEPKFWAYT